VRTLLIERQIGKLETRSGKKKEADAMEGREGRETKAHHLRVGLRDTLRQNLPVTSLVAHVPAILALVPISGSKKVVAESAEDDLEELSLDELMSVHLVYLPLPLLDGALSTESSSGIEWTTANVLLDCEEE